MRRIAAQYAVTNSGPPLKRAVITADDDGTIISIDKSGSLTKEGSGIEFYNGIIIPGFVNCHCHLELSHLKNTIPQKTGLGEFLVHISNSRKHVHTDEASAAERASQSMVSEGVVACSDICNTTVTFDLKRKSPLYYHNMLEVFGLDPEKAQKRIDDISDIAAEAEKSGLPFSLVPHTAYTVSLPLFRLLKEKTRNNSITSIHFMETDGEAQFLKDLSGPIREALMVPGMLKGTPELPASHISAIFDEVTMSGNLILVHNTCADADTVRQVQKRGKTFWCLCPRSNMYIEDKMPPAGMLYKEGCDIVIGTDSLASNTTLSILPELKLIQEYFPGIALEELIKWATLNGAKALCTEHIHGTIEPGKKPGLLLLENTDLLNFKLLPETIVTRLL